MWTEKFENGAFLRRRGYENHVTSLPEFFSNINPRWPVKPREISPSQNYKLSSYFYEDQWGMVNSSSGNSPPGQDNLKKSALTFFGCEFLRHPTSGPENMSAWTCEREYRQPHSRVSHLTAPWGERGETLGTRLEYRQCKLPQHSKNWQMDLIKGCYYKQRGRVV